MSELFPRPAVEDNVVHYTIYLPLEHLPTCLSQVGRTENELDGKVQAFGDELNRLAVEVSTDFFWQHDPFHASSNGHGTEVSGYACWTGESAVDDAINDEWAIVYILLELTKRFAHLTAQIADADGQFLLIETAEQLPQWVSPENSDNRVWLKDNALYLLDSSPRASALTIDQALSALYDPDSTNAANGAMQRLFKAKMDDTKVYMQSNRHTARCILPQRAIHVVGHLGDEIVGAAVRAFYYRDPSEMSAVTSRMKVFHPSASQDAMVSFSRMMYAQLKQQEFHPPKPFIEKSMSYQSLLSKDRDKDQFAAEMGMKLACGLELLYHSDEESKSRGKWSDVMDSVLRLPAPQMDKIVNDDDDSWLYVHPDGLEEQLRQKAETGDNAGEELQDIATMFSKFMDGMSSVDGVESSRPVDLNVNTFMELLQTGVQEEEEESDSDESDSLMQEAMDEMEEELTDTKLQQTLTRVSDKEEGNENGGLSLDYNLLSNLLESVASQEGQAGPATNILNELKLTK